jgi:hypothetical protein
MAPRVLHFLKAAAKVLLFFHMTKYFRKKIKKKCFLTFREGKTEKGQKTDGESSLSVSGKNTTKSI